MRHGPAADVVFFTDCASAKSRIDPSMVLADSFLALQTMPYSKPSTVCLTPDGPLFAIPESGVAGKNGDEQSSSDR